MTQSCIALTSGSGHVVVRLNSLVAETGVADYGNDQRLLFDNKGKIKVDLYSALDHKHLVLKAPKHKSHSLTCL